MEITYRWEGDYLIPNIIADEEPEEELTKYGLMREKYLKEYHPGRYSGMLLSGTLTEHCLDVQHQADELAEQIKSQLMKAECVNEELKEADQMEWVRRMNNIMNRVDEIVVREVVCRWLL
jgi:hypothetical protein